MIEMQNKENGLEKMFIRLEINVCGYINVMQVNILKIIY